MDFGKAVSLEGIDWRLPEDDPVSLSLATQLPGRSGGAPLLYAGGTGWVVPEWKGSYYPSGVKSSDFLYHYSRLFNTIEFNSTHYALPQAERIAEWTGRVPEHFRFAPKVLQRISHALDLGLGGNLPERFIEAIKPFGKHLGLCFMQMPPGFGPEQLPVLQRFLARWQAARGCPLAVELRHPDWFAAADTRRALFECLAAHGAGTVITDVAGRRDVLHQALTAPWVAIRFVGNNLHPSDRERLAAWAERLEQWAERYPYLQTVYFFLHQHDNRALPPAMAHLARCLEGSARYALKAPQALNEGLSLLF